ncbi:hypothetical protein R6Q59_012302 [Mikania micrantha]
MEIRGRGVVDGDREFFQNLKRVKGSVALLPLATGYVRPCLDLYLFIRLLLRPQFRWHLAAVSLCSSALRPCAQM